MESIAYVDFETYSESGYTYRDDLKRFIPSVKGKPGIKCANTSTYAMHPSTEVLSVAYDLPGGPGPVPWMAGMADPEALFQYVRAGGLIEAHKSLFEWYIWMCVCCRKLGWPPLNLNQMRCSMSRAKAWALPGTLELVGSILDADQKKDKRGAQLIRLLSVPQKPTKASPILKRTVQTDPGLHAEMTAYNVQDIVAEKSISQRMPELSPFELKVWQLDQRINTRGMAIDTEALAHCIALYYKAEKRYTDELIEVTGGAVQTVGEMTKRSAGDKWMISRGVNAPSLDKEGVQIVLDCRDHIDPAVVRALEIRQIIGSASVKKLFSLDRCVNADGRLRDLFVYCGAERTGRWSGSGSQPQNLKNSGPDCLECSTCGQWFAQDRWPGHCPVCRVEGVPIPHEWGNKATEAALEDIATEDLDRVEYFWGSALELIASCMRGLFIAAEGLDLICSDYSAIEAVDAAALAGEEWRLEVFRTHGKIYEASASKASGVPLEEILQHKIDTKKHHPLRKKGKIRELAGGYSGWIGAWKNFGADKYMTDDEIKADVLSWRDESPAIVEMWGGQWRKHPHKWQFTPELYGIEGNVIRALQNPGKTYQYRTISFIHDTSVDVMYIGLPSGRFLSYHQPRLTVGADQRRLQIFKISFMGFNTNPTQGPMGWVRRETYGGRLFENIDQAVSRDIEAAAMLRVEAAGYRIVLHVHDEIIAEIPKGFGSIEEFEALMMVRESWFADWPIRAAGGWRGKRYRK